MLSNNGLFSEEFDLSDPRILVTAIVSLIIIFAFLRGLGRGPEAGPLISP